jgi:hypothetical protein
VKERKIAENICSFDFKKGMNHESNGVSVLRFSSKGVAYDLGFGERAVKGVVLAEK